MPYHFLELFPLTSVQCDALAPWFLFPRTLVHVVLTEVHKHLTFEFANRNPLQFPCYSDQTQQFQMQGKFFGLAAT